MRTPLISTLRAVALGLVLLPLAARPTAAQTPTPTERAPALEELALRWMNYLSDGHFDSAAVHVSPQVAAQMGADALVVLWPQVTGQLGALQKLAPGGHSTLDDFHIVTLIGTFDAGVVDVIVVFNEDSEVMGFQVRPAGDGGG